MPSSNFSKQAHNYEANAKIQRKCALSLVENSLRFIPSAKPIIADLGCGTGTVSEMILNEAPSSLIENYDISEEMLALAKEKLTSKFASFFCQSLPVNSGYDMITSNFALQWYEDLQDKLKTCVEKLKKGGILSICIPIDGSFETLQTCFEKVDAGNVFFNFPKTGNILKAVTDTEILMKEIVEEELIYNSTLDFFKNLHLIGANQSDKNLSQTKLRKLIKYHDELFDGKIIVKYKILKLILKRVI